MAERDDFGAFVIGFIVGAVSGAVTALLLAPQSGEETRTYIKERAIELGDTATKTINETYEQAQVTANETVKRAETVLTEAKKRANDLTEKGKAVYDEQKAKLAGTISKVTEEPKMPPTEG
ncbi:YtxH domain-containing protein [bacterium]|nr:MAG: YtxH domain-containing protein [bacterium]